MGETTLHQAGGKNGSRFIHHERSWPVTVNPFGFWEKRRRTDLMHTQHDNDESGTARAKFEFDDPPVSPSPSRPKPPRYLYHLDPTKRFPGSAPMDNRFYAKRPRE